MPLSCSVAAGPAVPLPLSYELKGGFSFGFQGLVEGLLSASCLLNLSDALSSQPADLSAAKHMDGFWFEC